MTGQIRRATWLFAALVLASGFSWVAERLVAEDDIPRFLRQTGGSKSQATAEPPAAPAVAAGQRWREGATLSNVAGTFEDAGERITFHPQGGPEPFVVLENLMLERVERIRGETGNRTWVVNGVLTEFGGHNYLLLQRAVVAAEPEKSSPPAPATQAERS